MARLVAAYGSSHSAMLMAQRADWLSLFDHIDRGTQHYDRAGAPLGYEALLSDVGPRAAELLSETAISARFDQTARAMARLQGDITAARLDALVIVGDDQNEIFLEDCRPAVAVYYGATIRNPAAGPTPDDWYGRAQNRRLEERADAHYPVHVGLAHHLIEGLSGAGFDVTAVKSLADDRYEGHAFSFIHRRYLQGLDLPVVPIFLNTYFPPNQPTPARCLALGRALGELVARFPGDMRIGIMASGGLSHFNLDEELDAAVIAAMRRKDLDFLGTLAPHRLKSGSSEIRNWITMTGAAASLDLAWLSYSPGYRSRALTGVGLCFARWGEMPADNKETAA